MADRSIGNGWWPSTTFAMQLRHSLPTKASYSDRGRSGVLTSLLHPLFDACDPLPTEQGSTIQESCEANNLDSAAWASIIVPSQKDRNYQGQHPEAAAVPCTKVPSLRYRSSLVQ